MKNIKKLFKKLNNSVILFFIFTSILIYISSIVKDIKKDVLLLSANNKVILLNISDVNKIKPAIGDLRDIQLRNLEALKKLDKYFEKNQIKYWLDWGTLLGAIRHNGFIPWDDDVDIAMMRSDYNKILKLIENGIKIDNLKLYKTDVIHITNESDNLEIDIFPYDYIDTEKCPNILSKRRNFAKFWTHLIPKKKWRTYFASKLAENCNLKDANTIVPGLEYWHESVVNDSYTKSDIFPLKKTKFENIMLPIPNNPHSRLKQRFGNYMIPYKDFGYGRHF